MATGRYSSLIASSEEKLVKAEYKKRFRDYIVSFETFGKEFISVARLRW